MNRVFNYSIVAVASSVLSFNAVAQIQPLSQQMAATVMEIWKDSLNLNPEVPKKVKWAYDQGVVLEGIDGVWRRTGNGEYFKYMQKSMDFFVTKEGKIERYKQTDFNIDNVKNGRVLLTLYKVTGNKKYFTAATTLWEQLKQHPRTKEGGFWHKKIYPYQMWLDGLYMGQPFYAEYAALVKDEKAFDDIANQFVWMEKNARDVKTGLLYHGWDESKAEAWANKTTGKSPNFWGRAMGWYGMAMVDVLENFPENHPRKKEIIAILNRFAQALQKVQDPKSGLWFDVLDKPTGKGNYLEASASSMFVYTFAKAVRNGWLPASYFAVADKGYKGIQKEFIEQRAAGKVNLKGTVEVSGLGGKPYRDGSYEYYVSEKVITNDPKGVGAFLLAANEMEIAATPKIGKGKTVVLDSYFNNETKKDQSGNDQSWHYKWDERPNGGFSFWGEQFQNSGFKLKTLYQAPTQANLKNAAVYIIVDPDFEKENPNPNFISAADVKQISEWVKLGGVLVLMGNDAPNVELTNFNKLANVFGVHFNGDSKGTVPVATNFETAKVIVPSGNEIFKPKDLFIKEYSSLKLSGNAKSILKDKDGDDVISVTKFGKGTVFVIGDPWLYNEYVDGRKLPANYKNFEASQELVNWLAKQTAAKK
ncbi:glycoside hydrolase family 88 protein [Pedobacter chitinilyticus]|uniref:Glycoside hydrolase family 88 protein n=1 Tax=Pedobacter chitinilyticus TaxID=2233776 RepID=A0A3S3PVQ4_9SPHI|nr:glycoside hydrolase family 88 protein [Pedobacter chitinilyticus]RWU10527.1 glycoside hydrolase family 88 protein [Pedobacter chitinilyticus]